ncbi:MAG: hypothetical protein E7413_03365 [Ruminococcaceae bacterium]|nr:hypothetical protein [Oscillospiraceae bacterium]
MKNLKKLFCILLSLLLLTSCGATEEDPSLDNIKEQVQATDKLFGVAYLGAVDGDFKAVKAYVESQEFIKVYSFIKEIKKSHFVENEGSELYCVVPANSDVSISVYQAEMNEKATQLKKTEELLSKDDGKPILIRGNISDIMSNLMVVAKKGDVSVEYSPSLSLENGILDNSEQLIFEFTPYELMPQFNGLDSSVQWDFCGNWTATVAEANGETYQLNLSVSSDSCVELSFASETVSGAYTGNWLILSDQRLRLELGGETVDSKMPEVTGLHTDVDGIYYWDVVDGNLVLTYINGTMFYPAASVTEFLFTPAV